MPCNDVQGLEKCKRRAVVCNDVQGACSNCSSTGIDIYSNNCCVSWLTTSIHIIDNLKIYSMIRKSPNELKQEAPVLIYFNLHHSASDGHLLYVYIYVSGIPIVVLVLGSNPM